MNLKPIGMNKTELTLRKDGKRVRVLFSYQTPVAASIMTDEGMEFYISMQYYSKTTTKHIKSWLPINQAVMKMQDFFENLVS